MRDHYGPFDHPVLVDLPDVPTTDLLTEMTEIAGELRSHPRYTEADDEIAFRQLQARRGPKLRRRKCSICSSFGASTIARGWNSRQPRRARASTSCGPSATRCSPSAPQRHRTRSRASTRGSPKSETRSHPRLRPVTAVPWRRCRNRSCPGRFPSSLGLARGLKGAPVAHRRPFRCGRLWVNLGRCSDVCMTALPPKAEVHPRSCYVARVPEADFTDALRSQAGNRSLLPAAHLR